MSVAIKLLKDGCGRVEVPDGWRGVGKRLLDGWGNGCAMFESSGSRADIHPWTLPLRGERVKEIGATPTARQICRVGGGDGEEAGLGRLESIGVGSARRAERGKIEKAGGTVA